MPKKKRYTIKQKKQNFLEAYKACACNQSRACEKVHISKTTISKWLDEDIGFREEYNALNDVIVDVVESSLLKKATGYKAYKKKTKQVIIKGVLHTLEETEEIFVEPDQRAIEYYLNNKGKHRGYSNKQIIENEIKVPELKEQEAERIENLSDDDLLKFKEIVGIDVKKD